MVTLAGRAAATAAVIAGVVGVGAGVTGIALHGRGAAPATLPARASPATSSAGAAALSPGAAGAIPAPTLYDLRRPSARHRTPRPVALRIPAIGVRTRLIDLGLTSAGTIQVPADPAVAGWYTRSPRPGAIGSSIILGHVDSASGPAVFFRLPHLRPGTRVYIRRADGTLAVFRVDSVRRYDKSRFPTAAVYGPTPDAELRLVTCGGVFDQRLKSYLSNIVVYATAVT